jgi:hypothetical protein
MARRLGLDSPPARISPKLSPILVKELWTRQPDITPAQVIEKLGPERELSRITIYRHEKAGQWANFRSAGVPVPIANGGSIRILSSR